jgi:hypothetical protein
MAALKQQSGALVKSDDYVIGQSATHINRFTVTKFNDSGESIVTYEVVYNPETGYGKCNCPAGMYRNTNANDKHVKMVKAWLTSQKEAAGQK